MLGVQIKHLKTKNKYTIEELYEAIKDKQFSAGVPTLTKHGFTQLIAFPPLDRQNQVQIVSFKMKGQAQTFQIQKAEAAGIDNMLGNMAINNLTGGLFRWKQIAGNTAKQCEELVKLTLKELEALDL
jgi:16S rRNA U1498 N3-methylase RsmE